MAEEEKQEEKRDWGKILGLAFIALDFVVVGVGAFLVYSSTIGYVSPSVTEAELNTELIEFRKSLQNKPIIYTMDAFKTNLDGIPRRFILLRVNLEMLDEEGYEEVIGLGPEARDSIIRILNEKNYDDVETVQGKLHLKNQIASRLNGFLQQGVVKNVYFSDFVVQ